MRRIKKRYILALTFLLIIFVLKPALLINIKIFLFETAALPFRILKNIEVLFRTKQAYLKENVSLKEKSAIMALELSRMESISRENENLRELLGFKKHLPYKSIAAQVIARTPSAWNKAVIINKGRRHGIKKHMAVCTPKGLVGTVIESGPLTSKVMLITDPNSRIGVMLEKTGQAGVLVGTGQNQCKVIYLGMEDEIETGEKIQTSGFGGLFPKGIAVGEVENVARDKVNFYKYAIVKLGQSLNVLEEVLCIE